MTCGQINKVGIGYLKAGTKNKNGAEQWGVIHARDLVKDQLLSGIIHSVTAKGIRVSVGRDVLLNCFFGGVSSYFLPKEKTLEICRKYFSRGKKVVVKVTEANKKYAMVKMAEEYIDAEAEGLTMSKKRKSAIEKAKDEEKDQKMIKLELPKPNEVRNLYVLGSSGDI